MNAACTGQYIVQVARRLRTTTSWLESRGRIPVPYTQLSAARMLRVLTFIVMRFDVMCFQQDDRVDDDSDVMSSFLGRDSR